MSDAGQDQEQGEFAKLPLAEGGGNPEIGGDLLEGMEYAENGSGCGLGNRGLVEVAACSAATSTRPLFPSPHPDPFSAYSMPSSKSPPISGFPPPSANGNLANSPCSWSWPASLIKAPACQPCAG